MPLYLKIALRYLFGKKSTNAINIITGISVFGIAVGTAAIILIMSVFNGFEELMKKYLDAFNADVKIVPVEGKFFKPDEHMVDRIMALENVALVSQSVEEVAIFDYEDNQEVGIIKGVDSKFAAVTGLDSAMVDGHLDLYSDDIFYASMGAGIASKLNISTQDQFSSLKIYMPKRNRKGPMDSEFKSRNLYPNSIFSLRSEKDHQYVLADLKFAQNLIELRGEISSLEIKLRDFSDERRTTKELRNILGSDFKVLDRYAQDESFLKVMNIEKWSAFLMLGFTLVLIIFNVIGCLWMIVIDKKRDISVLKALGLRSIDIKKIYYAEGVLISTLGFLIGTTVAILLYFGQLKYGFIGVANAFSKTAYPILMKATDVAVVLVLVTMLGILASVPATRRAARVTSFIRSE